jgi:hypothetical protein
MRLLAFSFAALFFIASPAPAQELSKNPVSTGAVTPGDMTKLLEETATHLKSRSQTADRAARIDFAWPQDEDEYKTLNKHVIVLVSAVTRDAKELPLKRVYIRDKWNHETVLERLSSERRDVAANSLTYSAIGAHREDSFYLAPAGLMKSEGKVVADFTAGRSGFQLYELPGNPPDFIEADRRAMPAKDTKPDPKAVKAMIEREYAGFKLPDGLQ